MTPTDTTTTTPDRLLARATPIGSDAVKFADALGDGLLMPPAILGIKLTCAAQYITVGLDDGSPVLVLTQPEDGGAPVVIELPGTDRHRAELLGQLCRATNDGNGVAVISLHRSGRAHTITGRFG